MHYLSFKKIEQSKNKLAQLSGRIFHAGRRRVVSDSTRVRALTVCGDSFAASEGCVEDRLRARLSIQFAVSGGFLPFLVLRE